MRRYTDIRQLKLETSTVCRYQNYFPDDETRQILIITEKGEVVFRRFLYSGQELAVTKKPISKEAANEIFYALWKYAERGDEPPVPDMGMWSMAATDPYNETATVQGTVLFGSNTRELHLSDYVREHVGIPGLFVLDGVPFHRIHPDRNQAICEFSKKWIEIINHSPNWFTLMEDRMMEEMRALYFDMDFGKSFFDVYGIEAGRLGEPGALGEEIPRIHNVDILGSAICSQVYQYVRYADKPQVFFDQAEIWLNSALTRLNQLTKEVSY